ncbi:MAG: SLC13 family permease [Pirellulaceae bacterium]
MKGQSSPLILLLLAAVWVFAFTSSFSQDNDSADGAASTATADAGDAQPAGDADAGDGGSGNGGSGDGAADASNDAGASDAETSAAGSSAASSGSQWNDVTWPMITLGVGIAVVLGLIILLKVNAFIALISAAIVVSLMAPGAWSGKIGRVADAFGSSAGGIGIVIAMAAVIGKCMLDSGAADRVVRAFLNLLGEKRAPLALMGSGFVLAVPVFFDTVFYLLVPLARSMYRRTGRNYLMYIMAIAAGGAVTHTLVPPTPGPLVMAENLNFDVGIMIMIGALVALPAAIAGLVCAAVAQRVMPIPMRQVGSEPDPKPLEDSQLPSLLMSLLPVLLPVLLISTNTVLTTLADGQHAALFKLVDIQDWGQFQTTLREQAQAEGENPAKRILASLTPDDDASPSAEERRELAALMLQEEPLSKQQKQKLIDGVNQYVLPDKSFHRGDTEQAFLGIMPNDVARGLLKQGRLRMKKVDVERMNRALLESAYPDLLATHTWDTDLRVAANYSSLFGNANLALLLSTVIAMWTLVQQRGLTRIELAQVVEESLMSGGVIILITAGGGAFGAMLTQANVGEAIKTFFQIQPGASAGLMFLVLGFVIATVLKVAQGSSTVAMITGSGMLAGIASAEILGFHPVYLATAIGAGSLVGSWMNDSGFWIFAKMGGLTEVEALKSWSVMLVVLGVVSFLTTLGLAIVLPLA